MSLIRSTITSLLIIIQLVTFNAAFGMQNQQPQQPRPGLGARVGGALGWAVGATIDHGVVRLFNWITDADYTVGTLICRGLSMPCMYLAGKHTCKAIYNGYQMAAMRASGRWEIEGRTTRTFEQAGMDMFKNSAYAVGASLAALYLTNNPQRA